ncbi:MAG: [FeFe] hydrogenase, group A [Candidatus Erginobacter occultus]|nr:[FeFe] hydrogenase, group A [Candidatus Erginobacter occultus]
MTKLTINGIKIEVAEGTTILEAAKAAKMSIPTLCHHPDLPATAACGICVVKVKGRGNLVRSCASPVEEGMEVTTHDPEIVRVRRTILELILSSHPNECLTCLRNESCELQTLAAEFGIKEESFPPLISDHPLDDSTRSIVLDPRKCIKCGRCITVCQVKQNVWALSFLDRGIDTRISPAGDIKLSESPCIRCGQCSAHCPVGAITEYDQTGEVWEALSDPATYCVAQIAPSIRVSIGEAFGYEPGTNVSGQVYDALRRMGFDAVFDTNFGADVTIMEEATEFAERFKNAPETLPLITTCCPAWVDFMEKFHSEMIPYFSSCKSPQSILGVLAKTYYAGQRQLDPARIFMVSIMPCTAKKYEIHRHRTMFASGRQDVDVSITSRELIRMIRQSGLEFSGLDCLTAADSPLGEYSGAGTIFGATGGVMEAALRSAYYFVSGRDLTDPVIPAARGIEGVKEGEIAIDGKPVRFAVAHGLANVEKVLEKITAARERGEEPPYHFVEVMACPGGCIGGGGQAWKVDDSIRECRAAGLLKDDAIRECRASYKNPSIEKLYRDFLGEPLGEKARQLLHTTYRPRTRYRR